MAGYFESLPGPTREQKDSGNIREFVGDGTKFLKVPGLKVDSIKGIRIGDTSMPMEIHQEFPDTARKDRYVTAVWPMVSVAVDADGVPTLLRSPQSNFGRWQKNAKIYITGDWENDASKNAGTAKRPS